MAARANTTRRSVRAIQDEALKEANTEPQRIARLAGVIADWMGEIHGTRMRVQVSHNPPCIFIIESTAPETRIKRASLKEAV